MKIKKISLYNIGPYIKFNKFNLTIEKGRNIILVGGKNGAGKTTLFNAIKTCLYGCKIYGFAAPSKEYFSIINQLINTKTFFDDKSKAFIELELYFYDGKDENIYTLHREWHKTQKNITEVYFVKKNGESISKSEENDFNSYLSSLIPPDMFNFYFFDGEKISSYFLGSEDNKNFRNAFLKLYGLDTLSIMIENFSRNIRKSNSASEAFSVYDKALNECRNEEFKLEDLQSELREMEKELDSFQEELSSLISEYEHKGGISLGEWKEQNFSLAKEDSERENLNRQLKDYANHNIPFIILGDKLRKLQSELALEQEHLRGNAVKDFFSDRNIVSSLNSFLNKKQAKGIESEELIDFFKSNVPESQNAFTFGYSLNQIDRVLAQILEKQNFDSNEITGCCANLTSSLYRTQSSRDFLATHSVEGYEDFLNQRSFFENMIRDINYAISTKQAECEAQQVVYQNVQRSLDKIKNELEEALTSRSVSDISERSVIVFTELEEQLIRTQAKSIQKAFSESFSSIINKDNFIAGIVIDKKINIIPYKYVETRRGQLDNYLLLNREFIKLIDEPQIILDINKLSFGEVEKVMLPSPVKESTFSAGERQIFIMAIYHALLTTSHKDIPFFIDTPFARIDSQHRESLVSEFFNKLSNQTLILSTDEEIVGKYKTMLEDRISDKFVLKINEYGVTDILQDEYFED